MNRPLVLKECFWPFGIERVFLALMCEKLKVQNVKDAEKVNKVYSLHLKPLLAPIKFAILPLIKKRHRDLALSVYSMLKPEFNCSYDAPGGYIGRNYARQDEVGTPFCITIDDESLIKFDVTIRERDSKKQIRVDISSLEELLFKLMNEKLPLFGKL